MYDNTVHQKSIARHLRAEDFKKTPLLVNLDYKTKVFSDSVSIASTGFSNVDLRKAFIRGKAVYQISNLHVTLIIRHVTNNVQRMAKARQDNRDFIITCLKTLMREGVPFRVYKFDVSKFYESIDAKIAIERLRRDVGFSSQSVFILDSFFSEMRRKEVFGLPRGLSLSATLSEYIMREFDRKISAHPSVHYSSRFVDDIVIVTDGREDIAEFRQFTKNALENGLLFNEKSTHKNFTPYQKTNSNIVEHSFDFLGYVFHVSYAFRQNSIIQRIVNLDISKSKVDRIKSRIAKALLQFKKDGSYMNLRDRLRLLASNYMYADLKTGRKRPTGIYFNYPMVDANNSASLLDLDRFLRGVIMGNHLKNKLRPVLSHQQKTELVRCTFQSGFREKRFFHFSVSRLAHLVGCWSHA